MKNTFLVALLLKCIFLFSIEAGYTLSLQDNEEIIRIAGSTSGITILTAKKYSDNLDVKYRYIINNDSLDDAYISEYVEEIVYITFSPSGQDFFIHYIKDGQKYLRHNDKIYGPYDHIGEIVFKGNIFYTILHLAKYTYVLKNDIIHELPQDSVSKIYINIDGTISYFGSDQKKLFYFIGGERKGPYADVIPGEIVQMDSQYAFITKEGDKYYLIHNDKTYGPYDDCFSLRAMGSDKIAYVGRTANNYYVVSGSEIIGPYEELSTVVVNNDQTISYIYKKYGRYFFLSTNRSPYLLEQFILPRGSRIHIYCDKKVYGSYFHFSSVRKINSMNHVDSIGELLIDNDETPQLYTFKSNNHWYLKIGDEIQGPYDNVFVSNRQQNKSIHYYTELNKETYLHIDKMKYGPARSIFDFYVSPFDGKVIYKYSADSLDWLLIGDEQQGPFEKISSVHFSETTTDFALITKEQNSFYIILGKFRFGPYDDLGGIKFSTDGKNFNYMAMVNNEWMDKVIIENKEYNGNFIFQDNQHHFIQEGVLYEILYLDNEQNILRQKQEN